MESLDMSILDLSGIDQRRESLFKDVYRYNGTIVPRVSTLIDWCFDRSGLLRWASKCSEEEYTKAKLTALKVGTFTHQLIDDYLNGDIIDYEFIMSNEYRALTKTAVTNFIKWHNYFKGHEFSIVPLYIEYPVVTPWYGGTIDCIAEITFPNGYSENVIIDFKTSKSIGTEYIMQTFAYMWAVNWLITNQGAALPRISGTMIIRVDKNKEDSYNTTFLDINNNMYTFIELEKDLTNLVNWFYSQVNLMEVLKIAKATGKSIMEVDYNGREDSSANSD